MNFEIIHTELQFKATRSSGAGGQHVNKVSSKIELSFNVNDSNGLSANEKQILLKKLAAKLSKEQSLILTCQETRSQHRNKEIITKRFFELLKKAFVRKKIRIKTKPSRNSLKKNAENKRRNSLKKALRRKPNID